MARRRYVEFIGPEDDWLDDRMFSDYLKIPIDTFRELLRKGIIPKPSTYTSRTKFWHWEVCLWFALGMKHKVISTDETPE
jgi:hypothetical protein